MSCMLKMCYNLYLEMPNGYMKRKSNFIKNMILLALTCLFCPLVMISCSNDKVASISVNGKSEILVGDFDYEDYSVAVTYESGNIKTVPLDKSMLSVDDNLKFFAAGEQALTVNYLDCTCTFALNVCLYEFTDLRFDDVNAVYNGQYVTAEVFKNYPEGTEIYYRNGNSFVNAGTYTVTAIVSRRNYVSQELTAKVTIEKAEYDMSEIKLADCEFDYDGKEHTAVISGKLPDGVSVIYPDNNNKKVDAGTYSVTARFVSNNNNYLPIPEKTATMVINKKKYDAKDLAFKDSAVTYDGKEHSLKAENVPSGVYVTYSVEKQGYLDSEPVEGVAFVNAGTYVYTAEFHSLDPNYEDIQSATAKLEISPAVYDTSGIILDDAEIDYDGKPHSVGYHMADGSDGLPKGVSVYGGLYEKNGKPVYVNEDDEYSDYAKEVTDYGTYIYTLFLMYENGNYEIPELTAVLTINKIDYDVSDVKVEDYTYTGRTISVKVENIPKDVNGKALGIELYYFNIDDIPVCDEDGNYNCIKDASGNPVTGVKDVGEYRVLIKFTGQDNPNYNYLPPKTLTFKIV